MQKFEAYIAREAAYTFELALEISGDDRDEVLTRLIQQYSVEVLRQSTMQQERLKNSFAMEQNKPNTYPSKAFNRFAGWARKTHQTNHKIIRTFFACENDGVASREEMRAEFMRKNPERAPYFFENNLNSMTTDAGNSHGKCFNIIGDTVRFTDEIAPLAEEYRDCFVG